MSEAMTYQKYFLLLSNSRFLPYGMDYSLLDTNTKLTEVAINTLNNRDTFR
ncbi:unnamed protein product [Meloidogyne enterolobii]|uniref:Uncharacterized protein n=1 Tax=Meloidogyne enterolobii TaxID=390850 RepID=A0ACB0Y360_MELEN